MAGLLLLPHKVAGGDGLIEVPRHEEIAGPFLTPGPYRYELEAKLTKLSGSILEVEMVSTTEFDPRNCVDFVKYKTGYDQSIGGWAKYWPTNSEVPTIGGVIVLSGLDFQGRNTGHVALIVEVGTDYLIVEDVNYKQGLYTKRLIPKYPKNLIGFWKG